MSTSITRRVIVIATAVAVGIAMWSFVKLIGIDLDLKEDAPSDQVAIADVVTSTIVAGIAAWAVHAALISRHWARYWPFVGSTALSISIIGPGYLADGESAVALIAMHFVVGATLILGFARIAPGLANDCEDAVQRSPRIVDASRPRDGESNAR